MTASVKISVSSQNIRKNEMTAYIVPKNFSEKLSEAIAKAQKKDEDVELEEVISAFVAKLKPAKARKAKKDKDPNAPVRNKSAYIYFGKERRPELKAENPDVTFGDLTKMVAAEWKELSDKAKKPYVAQAAKDKKRYDAEKAAYDGSGSSASDSEEKPKGRGKKAAAESDEESAEKPKAKSKASGKTTKPKKVEPEDASDEEYEEKGDGSEEDVPKTAEEDGDVDYSKMTLPQLKQACKDKDVDVKGLKTKAQFVEALEA